MRDAAWLPQRPGALRELSAHHDGEADEEHRLHDAAKPIGQVGSTEQRVGDQRSLPQAAVDARDAARAAVGSRCGAEHGDGDGGEFGYPGGYVDVLRGRELKVILEPTARGADPVRAYFRIQPGDRPGGREAEHR